VKPGTVGGDPDINAARVCRMPGSDRWQRAFGAKRHEFIKE
jgi:hypothetical protein